MSEKEVRDIKDLDEQELEHVKTKVEQIADEVGISPAALDGCFLGYHNWNGGKKCTRCGKTR